MDLMEENEPSWFKSHITVIGLLVLVLGLVVGVALVSQQQLFSPKATHTEIEVKDSNNNPLPKQGNTSISDSPDLKIELKPELTP